MKNTWLKLLAVLLFISLILMNCTKDEGNPVESTVSDLSGIWSGTLQSNIVTTPAPFAITISHTNNNLSGTYSVTTGVSGLFVGTVSGNTINFTLTQTTASSPGSFTGQGTINGNTINFTYTGTDTWGHHTGSGSLSKYEVAGNVICPLYMGKTWIYLDSSFSSSGTLSRVDSSMLGIVGKTSINYEGQNLELFQWNWINMATKKPAPYSWLERNQGDGLNIYGGFFRNQPVILGKFLAQKYPVNAGNSWSSGRVTFTTSPDSMFRVADTITTTCTSVNQNISTPAGIINCYVYNYQRTYTSAGKTMTDDVYLYYAVNKGYIGMLSKTDGVVRFKKLLKR